MNVRWFETNDEKVKEKYLHDPEMSESSIKSLGFKELDQIESYNNQSLKNGILQKTLNRNRKCQFTN